MNTTENFENFKSYYNNWFQKVIDFVENKTNIKEEIVTSFENTPLGKWFYTEGKKDFGHLDQVVFLESKFKKLHNLVGYLWDSKTSGDTALTKLYYDDFLILSGRMIPNLELSKQYILSENNNKDIINLNS